ncbi:YbcC family protein [Undibacterium sp. SXout20W]|uniref:YbcC family protein n=1 Tax=Undibacterium sp. SXout20W TaxID=3413051 RepID=UPI003BF42DBD
MKVSVDEVMAAVANETSENLLVGLKDDGIVSIEQAVQSACGRVAPNWPLDRSIAVNPWWGWIDQPMRVASATMDRLIGSRFTMPLDWYVTEYRQGRVNEQALSHVLSDSGLGLNVSELVQASQRENSATPLPIFFVDMIDANRDLQHQPACRDVVIHAIGQHCASWFDRGQARWKSTPETSLYAAWREIALHDNGPSLFTGIEGIAERIAALPTTHEELIRLACEKLKLQTREYESYFSALLFNVNGWASWCAYLNWQAQLEGQTDNHLSQLLAITLAWEWVLADSPKHRDLVETWYAKRLLATTSPHDFLQHAKQKDLAWIWQEALERSWQLHVNDGLNKGLNKRLTKDLNHVNGRDAASPLVSRPALQAVFCIDVRSERIRRALETCEPSISTHGFAGFFGLPIDYLPFAGAVARPQLPGLLAPTMRVVAKHGSSRDSERLLKKRRLRLGMMQAWDRFRTSASSGFGFVETTGLSYALKLLKSSLDRQMVAVADGAGLHPSERAEIRPVLENVDLHHIVDLAANVLTAMSITSGFAPLVLLVGHGSQSANNPHAAGLDCGACCGQSGEVNARVLAELLNRDEVRLGLQRKGIDIPVDTCFIAGLHLTSTDELNLFDIPDRLAHSATLQQARAWLSQASQMVRAERAPTLGLTEIAPSRLLNTLRHKANDWSQVRPEWALANNAAFIAAPRQRTKHMNLDGRSFLNDYNHHEDSDHRVLEQILTAPVVVAHWINMQYFASTVDNRRWGSGNKVLHNVVGGNIGVFEGNGGDLRIGLPMQSLHDGQQWVHTPLRLSVWLEAPRAAIAEIVHKHEKLSQLVNGGWLHLFCIEPASDEIFRYVRHTATENHWVPELV